MTRKWTEQSVLDLMVEAGTDDPEEIVQAKVAELLDVTGSHSLPIDVEAIASFLGIRSATGDFEFAGRIYADPDGQLIMDLNARDEEPRRRFTCAHELIHTRFPGFTDGRYRMDVSVGANPTNREEEYLCDFGAAELLMPRSLIEQSYSLSGGLADVEALARDARVSLEAAANRLARVSQEPAAVLVFRLSHKPADGPALRRGDAVEPKVRLQYSIASGLNAYLPKFKSAQEGSVVCRAWSARPGGPVLTARELLPGADKAGSFKVEARGYGAGELRKVIAVATS